MRLLTLVLLVLAALLPLFAQSSESPTSQVLPTAKASESSTGFIHNPFERAPASSTTLPVLNADSTPFRAMAGQQSRHRLIQKDQQQKDQPSIPSLDPGIYANRETPPGASKICGAIVSYNFSPGDHPQLESVTTCTPGNTVTTKRAEGEHHEQSGPRMIMTK